MVFAKNTLMHKSEMKRNGLKRKNDLEWFLGQYLCVLLDYVVPFFYSCLPIFMNNEFWHLWAMTICHEWGALEVHSYLVTVALSITFYHQCTQ